MNGTVACGSCQASFSQLAELKHHNNINHVSPGLSKGDFHSQSFSSAEEFFARNQSKRQSLFDGVPFPERKRKRIENQVKSLEKSQCSTKESNLRKFLLMFDCKTCHKKFSKLGEFRKHLESAHSTDGGDVKNDNDVPNPEPKPLSRQVQGGGHIVDCSKCKVFKLDDNFKFPFGPKFQARLLQEKAVDLSSFEGFSTVPRKTPAVKARTVMKFAGEEFLVNELKGQGGFARVFSATWRTGPDHLEDAVMKVQRPANDWEWYMLKTLHRRLEQLEHPLLGHGSSWHQVCVQIQSVQCLQCVY